MIGQAFWTTLQAAGVPAIYTRVNPPSLDPTFTRTVHIGLRFARPSEIGGLVQAGDATASVAALEFPATLRPAQNDRLNFSNRTWLVVSRPTPLYSGADVIGWELHIRGS